MCFYKRGCGYSNVVRFISEGWSDVILFVSPLEPDDVVGWDLVVWDEDSFMEGA